MGLSMVDDLHSARALAFAIIDGADPQLRDDLADTATEALTRMPTSWWQDLAAIAHVNSPDARTISLVCLILQLGRAA